MTNIQSGDVLKSYKFEVARAFAAAYDSARKQQRQVVWSAIALTTKQVVDSKWNTIILKSAFRALITYLVEVVKVEADNEVLTHLRAAREIINGLGRLAA